MFFRAARGDSFKLLSSRSQTQYVVCHLASPSHKNIIQSISLLQSNIEDKQTSSQTPGLLFKLNWKIPFGVSLSKWRLVMVI